MSDKPKPKSPQVIGSPSYAQIEAPLLSIIIPTKSRVNMVREGIASIRQQKVAGVEIIVVDDESTDETPTLQREPDVTYVRAIAGGPAAGRNIGMGVARGKFIGFLDDDDVWLPDWLPEALKRFEDDPTVDVVFAQAQMTNGDLSKRGDIFPTYPAKPDQMFESFLVQAQLLGATILRREAVETIGLLDEELYGTDDRDWVLKMIRSCKIACLSKAVLLYRIHDRPYNPKGGETWKRRVAAEKKVLHRHFPYSQQHGLSYWGKVAIELKHMGFYAHYLLAQATRDANEGADTKRALSTSLIALQTSSLHTLKDKRFWRILASSFRRTSVKASSHQSG